MNRKMRRRQEKPKGAQGSAQAHAMRGNELIQSGNIREAIACWRKAVALDPSLAAIHYNIGRAASELGDADQAIAAYSVAASLAPEAAEVHYNLGCVLRDAGRFMDAETAFAKAVERAPGLALAHDCLGSVRATLGQWEAALECHATALRLSPGFPEALLNMGNAFQNLGRNDEAIDYYQQALRQRPKYMMALGNLGAILKKLGRLDEAIEVLSRAVRFHPDEFRAHLGLASVLWEKGLADATERGFRKALELSPASLDAVEGLASFLQEYGRFGEAMAVYDQFLRLEPGNLAARLGQACLLPVIPASEEEIISTRMAMRERLAAIGDGKPVQDPSREINRRNFYLAYHEMDDLELQRMTADAFLRACPDLAWTCQPKVSGDGRIKIGILSRYLRQHTIGKLMIGLIEQLDRRRFHVTLCRLFPASDPLAARLDAAVDEVVAIPSRLDAAREKVAECGLDVLFYPDIGMDTLTYFLAFSRLAPVQVVSWGHPDTTGIPNMDYYLSAKALEPAGAQSHYSERLIQLEHHLPTYYLPVQRPEGAFGHDAHGLNPDDNLYVCPQSLFKLHPSFDPVLGRILDRDPRARIVLISGTRSSWEDLLRSRFARAFPEHADRVVFLPSLPHEEFLRLLIAADAVLDSVHFSGGLSTYETLAMGVPVVTWPGAFMRDRVSYALYSILGVGDMIATDADSYVDLALRVATDKAFKADVSARIRKAFPVLVANPEPVREIEAFLEAAVAAARAGRHVESWPPQA
jgi:protein O-GlcNAc transferase